MTVYFARKISDPTAVKIGVASDVDKRLTTVAREVGPIRLVASMPGGKTTERQIQIKFSHLRTEGEWFRADDALENYISVAAEPCNVEFGTSEIRWKTKAVNSLPHREKDARNARRILNEILAQYPREITVAAAMESVFVRLHSINDCWTRRRVRALRELQGLRIDVFEIIDMLTLLEVPRLEWASWIAPLVDEVGR